MPAFGCEFSSIADDIHQYLFGVGGISFDTGRYDIFFYNKAHTPALDIICLHRGNLIDQSLYQHGFVDEVDFAGLELGYIQDIVYQRQKVVGCAMGFFSHSLICGRCSSSSIWAMSRWFIPISPFKGVRISWLILERNSF